MTGLRAGEVATAAGVNRQTLRYYEKVGLLTEPDRTPGGHRLYPAETVTVLRVIKAAQRLGFTLDEVAELLDLGRHRHDKHGLQARAIAKLAEIEAKISDLEVVRDTLKAAVAAGCDEPMQGPAEQTRRLAWLAGAACLLCCLVPVLGVAGVAGSFSAIGFQDVLIGLGAAVVAGGVALLVVQRRRRHQCAGGDCGCKTS